MLAIVATPITTPQLAFQDQIQIQIAHTASVPTPAPAPIPMTSPLTPIIPNVPFFSQFKDITAPAWQEVGCGITSLAMMIDFYKPHTVSVNNLLQEGIAQGAYDATAGWSFGGLISLANQYGLKGSFIDLTTLTSKNALSKFKTVLTGGPIILAVHNKFDPTSSLSHLIVIDGIKNNMVYYNDPAANAGEKMISIAKLVASWEEKVIVVRSPTKAAVAYLN